MPSHTTKRRTTPHLKTITTTTTKNENCQKIKLYGNLTTKELKKKHSSRLVGGAEMESWGGEDTWQGSGTCGEAVADRGDLPHSCADMPGETTGE